MAKTMYDLAINALDSDDGVNVDCYELIERALRERYGEYVVGQLRSRVDSCDSGVYLDGEDAEDLRAMRPAYEEVLE